MQTAVDFPTLVANRYVPPGGYIGQLIRPKSTTLNGTPNIPCYVGKGSRFSSSNNDTITRGFIVGSVVVDPTSDTGRGQLSFTETSPYTATLPYVSKGDQSLSRVYAQGGREVPRSKWAYAKSDPSMTGADQIVILDSAYDPTTTYFIDYQSIDRSAVDVIPYNDIRRVKKVGLQIDQALYIEHDDFYLPSTITAANRDYSGNDIDGDGVYNGKPVGFVDTVRKLSGTSGDGLTYTGTPAYNDKYDRVYYLGVDITGTAFAALQTLVKELGVDYTAHLAEGATVHLATDSTNVLEASTLTLLGQNANTYDRDDIVNIVEDLRAKYIAHAASTAKHTAADTLNVCATMSTAVTTLGRAWRMANLLRYAFEVGGLNGGAGVGHFNQTASSVHGSASAESVTAPLADFEFNYYGQPGTPGWVNNSDPTKNLVQPDFASDPTVVTLTAAAIGQLDDTDGVGSLSGTFAVGSDSIPVTTALIDADKVDSTDVWLLEANGPGIFELDERYNNTNQFMWTSDVIHPVLDLVNDLRSAYEAHRVRVLDGANGAVHGAGYGNSDLVNEVTEAVATDLATAIALVNDIKAQYNAHEALDSTNNIHLSATNPSHVVSSADASSWSTVETLANEIRTKFLLHIASTARHTNDDDVTQVTVAASGTGVLAYSDTSSYSGAYNRKYAVRVSAVNGSTDADFEWVSYGEYEGASSGFMNRGTATAVADGDTITLDNGISLDVDLGATNFIEGEIFTFTVLAPRIWYKGKDDREYLIRVTGVQAYPSNSVTWAFYTNTPEGSFATGKQNSLNASSKSPYTTLADNVKVCVRNLGQTNSHSSTSQSSTGDKHQFAFTMNGTIDWNLKAYKTETIAKASFRQDPTGVITGVPGARYFEVRSSIMPDDGSSYGEYGVKSVVNESLTPITYVNKANTKIIYVTSSVWSALTTAGVTVTYIARGSEPSPGQHYYWSADYLRPDELYDTPLLLVGKAQAQKTLYPIASDNHLAIMSDMAYTDSGLQAIYVVQVKDIDHDGVYSTTDYQRAIDAAESIKCTDIIVLDGWDNLSDVLTHLDNTNDPLVRKPRLGWFGAPIGTEIGDSDTTSSLVYTARRTLQVYGDSNSHGTRILVAPTYGVKEIVLDDGTTQEVTLDGSFIAGCLAAQVAAFSQDWNTLLKKTLIGGWKSIQTYTEVENLTLGGSSIIYFTDEGSSVYRIEESVTVDKYADDFAEISAMKQKHATTRKVIANIDATLIGYVAPSPAAALSTIKGSVVETLTQEVSAGNIGRYQDDNDNDRKINPDTDVIARRSVNSRTDYNVIYGFYLRYPIKRVFGLYTVDTNNITGQGV